VRARGPAIVSLALGIAGCQTDVVCDPAGVHCGQPGIESTFANEDPFAHEVAGRVRLGTEPAAGVLVRIDASPGYASATGWTAGPDANVVTNDYGFYRFTNAPLLYDLTMRQGLDVFVMRNLAQRYVEPPFGDDAAPRAFTAHVDVVVDPPIAPGHVVAFLVSGDEAVAAAGTLASGADVLVRGFSRAITLHVVAFDPARTLAAPSAYGKVDVRVQALGGAAARVALAPVADVVELIVRPSLPPGFVDAGSDLSVDFGVRTSARHVTPITPGSTVVLKPIPGARYLMRTRARAVAGGATSDSGLFVVDTTQPSVTPTLPAPPVLVSPSAGGMASDGLSAAGEGVLEHVLVPADPRAPTVRIVTREGLARLPDLSGVGLGRPTGKQAWSVRAFPGVAFEDGLSGPDARVAQPNATSEPRAIVLP
jgi:hypothetical protein